MRLTVNGFTPETSPWYSLWGYYVRGFNPWEHCQDCFVGERADGISPKMTEYEVDLPKMAKHNYFYLCGVAKGLVGDKKKNNLHFAVRPQPGSVAKKTHLGVTLTIEDAEEIEIQGYIEGTTLTDVYTHCANFRFALQMYPTPIEKLGPDAWPGKVIRSALK